MSGRHWAPVYLKAIVTVRQGDAWVDAGAYAASVGAPVHVLTAWNPDAARPSETVNRAANERLRADLVNRGLEPMPALGADPDSPHVEESWAVVGLSDDEARVVGAAFDQVAVFRVTASELAVLACREDWAVRRALP
ncbi:MAG: DUF3293 domain-containing protein [Trueperaceae bacterium]|nr:DUF3293 domain-containing protein [Trueperaceae bacterium]